MTYTKKIKYYWQYIYIDTYLLFLLLVLCFVGFIVLYSSTDTSGIIYKQLIHFLLAIIAMFIMAQIPPYILKYFAIYTAIFGFVLLILVLFIGSSSKGATRWLDLVIFRVQPSELMKIIMPIIIASILAGGVLPPKFKQVFLSSLIIIAAVFLIYKQPDLGTAVLIASSGIYILFFSGLSWSIFKKLWLNVVSFFAIIISIATISWFYILYDYQKQRIITFLNPDSNSLDIGYHIIQSKIAIGSGGLLGKGWMQGSQSQLNFLPEHHTDFIFSIIAEEFGFLGVILLLILYALIIHRCLVISLNSNDNFSRLLGTGLTATFFTYVFVNMSMVSGLLPVVGVPLPLISYGGSSYISLMISFGIIMSINHHKYSPLKYRK